MRKIEVFRSNWGNTIGQINEDVNAIIRKWDRIGYKLIDQQTNTNYLSARDARTTITLTFEDTGEYKEF